MLELMPWRGDPGEIVAAADPDPTALLRRIAAATPPWHTDAACHGTDHNVFFPERGQSVRRALEICAGCTVQRDCLDYALTTTGRDIGIWGGTTAKTRRALRQAEPHDDEETNSAQPQPTTRQRRSEHDTDFVQCGDADTGSHPGWEGTPLEQGARALRCASRPLQLDSAPCEPRDAA